MTDDDKKFVEYWEAEKDFSSAVDLFGARRFCRIIRELEAENKEYDVRDTAWSDKAINLQARIDELTAALRNLLDGMSTPNNLGKSWSEYQVYDVDVQNARAVLEKGVAK